MRKFFIALISLQLLASLALARGGEEMTPEQIIQMLDLKPLPEEGGYYRETFRSNIVDAPAKAFGIQSANMRTASTAIYYMVTPDSFSALHRVASDEVFHFYSGDPVEMIQIDQQGNIQKFIIGSDILNGQTPQVIVKKGVWQGLKLIEGGRWALMGTTVAPGFEFEDFEIGHREELTNQFPQHSNYIEQFTREP